jgi:hypothetical protein
MTSSFSIFGWKDDRRSEVAIFTPWSFVHLAMGFLAASIAIAVKLKFSVGFAYWFLAHLLYETKDVYFSYFTKDGHPNSLVNSFGDQGIALAGFAFGFFIGVSIPQAAILTIVVFVVMVSPLTSPVGQPTTLVSSWFDRG